MTVDNAEVNISPLIQSSDDSQNESKEKEAVDEEVLSESIDKSKPYMQTSSEYDSTGNYVTAETNEQGSTTHYVYDVNGDVTSITDADENVTSYTYDSSGNLTSVKNGDSENSYTYSGLGSVSKITHNGFDYSFNYDVFYNLVSTKIGNVTVASRTYDSNGNLTKTAYANGDYLEMECYTLKPVSIFLEILFLFSLIIYIVYVFVIKKDYSVLRIIIFAILLLSFVINMLHLFFQ